MQDQRVFFDARAADWETRCYPPAVRTRLQDLLLEFPVSTGMRVLDIGTGSGILYPWLQQRVGAQGQVFGCDLSSAMLREARKKLCAPGNVFLQGDAHLLPFSAGCVDAVVCFAAFPHFADGLRVLGELARILRPQGALVIAHLMSRAELARHHGQHRAVEEDLLPDATKMQQMLLKTGFRLLSLVDEPGRYLLKAEYIR